jgi:hypothetical protein
VRDSHRNPETNFDRGAPPGVPRWVKGAAIMIVLVVLALVLLLLIGGDEHGPGRHAGAVGATQQMAQQPAGDESPAGSGSLESGSQR